jgi:hypothetical protein
MRDQQEQIICKNVAMAYCISAPGATILFISSLVEKHVRLSRISWMNSSPPKQGYPQ